MIALAIIVMWLGFGALGAWGARRHWHMLFAEWRPVDEASAVITCLAGPIGLFGVMLWVAASGTAPVVTADDRQSLTKGESA